MIRNSPLNKELSVGPSLSTGFMVFNVRKPPFDDPKVRQAFAMAINRQQIADVVYKKMVQPAVTILPPGMPGYTDNQQATKYDPAQAKQLLAQSKYAGKLPDITWTTSGRRRLGRSRSPSDHGNVERQPRRERVDPADGLGDLHRAVE